MPLTVIFLGKAGAGKGTQGHLLEQKIKMKVVGTGDLLRAFTALDIPAARRIEKEVLLAGKLAPSWFVSYLWMHEVLHAEPKESILFDGSPRMLPEALLIDDVLDWNGRIPPKVFLLDISDEEATRRLLSRKMCEMCKKIYQGDSAEVVSGVCPCGGKLVKRRDDVPKAIQSRLAYFKTDVVPVIEHYQKKEWLIRINGEQSPEKVHEDILKHLG
ncbi:MAG: nucleoside monophosphate kinase [bacterium]|nr:nucleoside monophosphate kinase [bacterium]